MCPQDNNGKKKGRKEQNPGDEEGPADDRLNEDDIESTLPIQPPPQGTHPPTPPPGAPQQGPEYTLPATGPGQEDMYTLPMTPPPEGQLPPGQTPPPHWPASTLPPTNYPPGYVPPGPHAGPQGTFPPAPPPGSHPPQYQTPTPHYQTPAPHTPTSHMGGTTPPSTHPYHQPSFPPTAPLPPASVFANRFEILGMLGEGGMGQVFRVRDRQIENSEAALKVLHPQFSANPQFRDLFFKEINNSKQFVSEYVTQVRDTGHEEGRLFLTMDLVDGEPLRSLIDREKSLDARHALEITRQTLLGLSSGHEKGLIHRDIKPSNIMLVKGIPKTEDNPFGVGVRLLDFGIAAVAEEMSDGQIAGTPMYMSPEQASGQKLDARSDLFSLGNVLFEMISGSRLFRGKTVQDITTSVLNVQVGPRIEELEHLSPAIQKILKKALEKDRKKRYQSAEEFIAAIEKSSAYRMPKGAPVWMGGLLAVSMAAAVGLGYLYFEKTRQLELVEVDSISRSNHDSLIQGKDKEISELTAENRELANRSVATGDDSVRIEALEADVADKAGQIQGLQGTVAAAGVTENRLQGEKTDLNRDLVAERERREVAEAAVEQYKYRDTPAVKKASRFDLIISLVSKGEGSGARLQLESIQAEDLLSPQDLDGGEFLEHLVLAAESLHHYQQDPNLGFLAQAGSSLQDAQAGHDKFLVIAKPWLDTPLEIGQEAPARGAQLRRALEAVSTSIDGQIAANQEKLTSLKAEAESFTASTDFAKVKAFGEQNGLAMLATFFDRYAQSISNLVIDDGRLRKNTLFKLPRLQYWGQALAQQPGQVDTTGSRTVSKLWDARVWYSGQGQPTQQELTIPAKLSGEPLHDWELQLALQMAMAGLDSAAIANVGGRNVYRDQRLDLNGQTQWVVDSLASDGSKSTITRRLYNATGKPITDPVPLPATFSDLRFKAGSVSLDLTQLGPNISVALWQPNEGETAPDGNVWSLGLDTGAFASKLSSSPVPCLVVKDGTNEFWYSPKYGLVRERRPGFIFRDLVETK